MRRHLNFVSATLLAGLSVCVAAPASAHIVMVGDVLSRDNQAYGNAQKMNPCDGPRANGQTYTYEPGTTITLSISEAIPHPSYFRIAFDNDGEDGFAEPASINPIDPGRLNYIGAPAASATNKACMQDTTDHCGASDFCNVVSTTGGATVLWDNLNPHTSSMGNVSWNVKLPNVECENCTIQVIQVMEDASAHGPYCPQGICTDTSLEDIYHRCINITLKHGATNSKGVATGPVQNMGVDCLAQGASTDGGVSTSDGGPASGSDGGAVDGGVVTSGPGSAGTDAGPVSGSYDAGVVATADGSVAAASDGGSSSKESDGGGCAVQPGAQGLGSLNGFILALGGLLVARRRRRAG